MTAVRFGVLDVRTEVGRGYRLGVADLLGHVLARVQDVQVEQDENASERVGRGIN